MREAIREQLQQVKFADLSHYDETTGVFNIPKYGKPAFELNKTYIVKVDGELVNNPNTVIAANWNNGTAPKSAYLKIYVTQRQGKMLRVESVAFDMNTRSELNIMWGGWLPFDQLTQIEFVG